MNLSHTHARARTRADFMSLSLYLSLSRPSLFVASALPCLHSPQALCAARKTNTPHSHSWQRAAAASSRAALQTFIQSSGRKCCFLYKRAHFLKKKNLLLQRKLTTCPVGEAKMIWFCTPPEESGTRFSCCGTYFHILIFLFFCIALVCLCLAKRCFQCCSRVVCDVAARDNGELCIRPLLADLRSDFECVIWFVVKGQRCRLLQIFCGHVVPCCGFVADLWLLLFYFFCGF